MYMECIQPDLAGVEIDSRPRATGARVAAGLGVIAFAAILAFPYWAALTLWLGAALLIRAGAWIIRLGYETVLFAGDLVLGQRKDQLAPDLLREGR